VRNSNPCNHRNQQYSIVGLTNAAGTLVERYSYTAYGTLGIYDPSGTVRTTSTYANRYTYTGRAWDADLNLYHFRASWYDPATGGFISRDPLGYVDGMSLYRGYFGLKGGDPFGELSRWIDETQEGSKTQAGSTTPTAPTPIERWVTVEVGDFSVNLQDPRKLDFVGSTETAEIAWFHDGILRGWTDRIRESYGDDRALRLALEGCTRDNNGAPHCIKEIRLFGHGFPRATLTKRHVRNIYNQRFGLFSSQIKQLFKGLRFCEPCEIWVHSCESGVRPDSNTQKQYNIGPLSIAEEIALETGCVVYGTKGTSESYGSNIKIVSGPDGVSYRGDDCWEAFRRPTCDESDDSGK
jgi:RHS repeat-associated protein